MNPKSSTALQKAKVTGFTSNRQTFLIYAGSTSWIIVLLLLESFALASDMWNEKNVLTGLLVASISLNVVAYLAQTVDYVYYHFLRWPVTAINWTAQLSAVGTASALVGYAVSVPDDDRDVRVATSIVHLVAQALFLASQFSVTLEYFERRVIQNAVYSLPHTPRRTNAATRTTRVRPFNRTITDK